MNKCMVLNTKKSQITKCAVSGQYSTDAKYRLLPFSTVAEPETSEVIERKVEAVDCVTEVARCAKFAASKSITFVGHLLLIFLLVVFRIPQICVQCWSFYVIM
jgi:hypothetical protein